MRARAARRRAGRNPGAADRQAGGAVVELLLLSPALVMLLLAVVALGRLTQARLRVDDASFQAARAASLQATAGQARTAADQAARAALPTGSASCTSITVNVDTADFVAGGSVSVTVSCTVSLAHMALLDLPGSRTVASTATAPVDRFGLADPASPHPLGPSPIGPRALALPAPPSARGVAW